jgi:hypothetical protein
MSDLRFPIGPCPRDKEVNPEKRATYIKDLVEAPSLIRATIAGLNDAQLDTPYREGGWTARQVVHHLPDSHANAYVRFRMALTEDSPTIKPYDEKRWAVLSDAVSGPVEPSLKLLEALHARWVMLLTAMKDSDFHRQYNHPEGGLYTLAEALGSYAWHGRHHAAHIRELRDRMGW